MKRTRIGSVLLSALMAGSAATASAQDVAPVTSGTRVVVSGQAKAATTEGQPATKPLVIRTTGVDLGTDVRVATDATPAADGAQADNTKPATPLTVERPTIATTPIRINIPNAPARPIAGPAPKDTPAAAPQQAPAQVVVAPTPTPATPVRTHPAPVQTQPTGTPSNRQPTAPGHPADTPAVLSNEAQTASSNDGWEPERSAPKPAAPATTAAPGNNRNAHTPTTVAPHHVDRGRSPGAARYDAERAAALPHNTPHPAHLYGAHVGAQMRAAEGAARRSLVNDLSASIRTSLADASGQAQASSSSDSLLDYLPNPRQAGLAAAGVFKGAFDALCGIGHVAGAVVVGGTAQWCGADPKGYFGDAMRSLDELADGIVTLADDPTLIYRAPMQAFDDAINRGDAFGAGQVAGETGTNAVIVADAAVNLGRSALNAARGTATAAPEAAVAADASAAGGRTAVAADASAAGGRPAVAADAGATGGRTASTAGRGASQGPTPTGGSSAPAGTGANVAPAGGGGTVALDTNALINGLEGGELAALDAAIAGRTPTVSITAAKEFLRRGDVNVLRQFLVDRGGRIGAAATAQQIAQLQAQAQVLGRVLRLGDASVTGSAITEGATILTRDARLLRFLQQAGIPAAGY